MKITQEEFNNIVNMINSREDETVQLGIGILDSLFPSRNYNWVVRYYLQTFGNRTINCSIIQFWLNYIQAHFVE